MVSFFQTVSGVAGFASFRIIQTLSFRSSLQMFLGGAPGGMKITTFLVLLLLARKELLATTQHLETYHFTSCSTFLWDGGDFPVGPLVGLLNLFGDVLFFFGSLRWHPPLATVGAQP